MSSNGDPSLLIVGGEPRKRGRPRIAPETSSISTRIWSAHHDALIKAADQRGVSLSQHVREVLGRSISALKIPSR